MTLWKPEAKSEVAQNLYAQFKDVRKLEVEKILDKAIKTAKTEDWGSDDFMPRLQCLVDDINAHGHLNPLGSNLGVLSMVTNMVSGRIRLQSLRKQYQEYINADISRPIFIVGGSRTGTTLLQRLMSADPANRSPLLWEMQSVSTVAAGNVNEMEKARNRCDFGQKMFHTLNPTMPAVHYSEADGPEECVLMMGTDLRNISLMSCINVPSYTEMLGQEDFTESYQRHKWNLQLLSRGDESIRWLLKAPYHLPFLREIAKVYPGARIIHTHRDVVDTVTSTCSLYSVFRSTFSDRVDPVEVGQQQLDILSHWFNGAVQVRKELENMDVEVIDVHYRDLVSDPMKMIENIYNRLDLQLDDSGINAMTNWLSHNKKGKHGGHTYTPEMFGLNPEQIRDVMAEYRAHFSVS